MIPPFKLTLTLRSMLVDPYTYNYFHSHWTDGYTDTITPFDGIHTTNVTQQKALDFLDDAAKSAEQWFMMVTPGMRHLHLKCLFPLLIIYLSCSPCTTSQWYRLSTSTAIGVQRCIL